MNKKRIQGTHEDTFLSEHSSLDSLTFKKGHHLPHTAPPPAGPPTHPNPWGMTHREQNAAPAPFGPRSPTFPSQTNDISLTAAHEEHLKMLSSSNVHKRNVNLNEEQGAPSSFSYATYAALLKNPSAQFRSNFLNPQRSMPLGFVEYSESKTSLLSGILPSSCMSLDVNISGSPVREYFIASTDQLDQDSDHAHQSGLCHYPFQQSPSQPPRRHSSWPNVSQQVEHLPLFTDGQQAEAAKGDCSTLKPLKSVFLLQRPLKIVPGRHKCSTLTASVNNILRDEELTMQDRGGVRDPCSQQCSSLNLHMVPLAASSVYSLRSPRIYKRHATVSQMQQEQVACREKRLLNQKCHAWLMNLEPTH